MSRYDNSEVENADTEAEEEEFKQAIQDNIKASKRLAEVGTDELQQVIEKAAQSFSSDPITKGTIWASYIIPQGFMNRLIPALESIMKQRDLKLLDRLEERMPKKLTGIGAEDDSYFDAGHNHVIDEVKAIIQEERGK